MSYEFTKLSDVPVVNKFPIGANAIIEANGEIRRCPSVGDGSSGGSGESVLILKGKVLNDNSIEFNSVTSGLTSGQGLYNAAVAAYEAGRVVQIDVTNNARDWNTVLTLSRVDLGGLQFFNYEKTVGYEEQRLQLVEMSPDGSATYSYITPLTLATLPKYGGEVV